MKRAAIITLAVLAGGVLVLCVGSCGYALHRFHSADDGGSPKLAAEWKAELEGYSISHYPRPCLGFL